MQIYKHASVGLIMLFIPVWISCNGQSSSLREAKNSEVNILGKQVAQMPEGVTSIFQDSGGNYWFAGDGVYKYDGENLTHFTLEDGLCGMSVLGIQEDQFGNLFFDSTEGVSKFDGSEFTTLPVVSGDAARGQWKLNPNDLWFRMGWDRSGPLRYDGTSLYALEFPKSEQEDIFRATYPSVTYNPYGIYYIYQDHSGNMWFGTSSLGLCRFDGTKVQWMYEDQLTNTPDGASFGIRSIIEDQQGHFWICNTRHRYAVAQSSTGAVETDQIEYTALEGLGPVPGHNPEEPFFYMAICEDSDGNLCMDQYDQGVTKFTGTELIHYPVSKDGEHALLFTSYIDQEGVIWLGSRNFGAWRFNGEKFEQFIPQK